MGDSFYLVVALSRLLVPRLSLSKGGQEQPEADAISEQINPSPAFSNLGVGSHAVIR
jgi:hypothetical protein